jgi:PAS domain S-box-containing protein
MISPHLYEAIFRSLPGKYVVLSRDFFILDCSDAYLKSTGTLRNEIVGKNIFEVFPENPGDPNSAGVAALKKSLNRVVLTKAPDKLPIQQYDIKNSDGVFEARYWLPVSSPILDLTGEVTMIIHWVEDVTDYVLNHAETNQLQTQLHILSRDADESEKRLRIVLDGLEDHAIIRTNRDHLIIDWNKGAENIFGYRAGEVIGKPVSFLFAGEGAAADKIQEEFLIARNFGKVPNNRWCRRKNNERFFAKGVTYSLKSDGKAYGFLKVLQDFTQEKQRQDQLKDTAERLKISEARFRTLLDRIPHIVWYAGADNKIQALSRQFSEYTGIDLTDGNTEKKFVSVIHPDDLENTRMALHNAKENMGTITVYQRLRRADGEYRWNLSVGNPYYNESDEFIGWIGTTTDVHEQKVAEEELKLREDRAQQIANRLPIIVWTADKTGHVDWYNDWWYEYLGLPRGTKWDDPNYSPMHPDDVERTKKLWAEAVSQGKNFQMEQRFKRGSDGQYRWHIVRGVPVKDENGKVLRYVGGNTDVHDQKILTEELKQARQEAEAASQAKSSFLANMSHEIRTPMTAILGFTEVLRDSELDRLERQDAIARIDSSGRALLRLIDDILDISKIEAGKLTVQRVKFSPIEVATEVVSLLKLSAESKFIGLKLKVEASTPISAFSDPARVRQILMNLVGNAVKFTSAGEVVLKIKSEANKFLIFDVCDTGIGISKEDQAKLFMPFAQADSSITRTFGGTGLGLLLSKRLTEQLGGNLVLAESTPGKGSRFRARIEAGPFHFGTTNVQDDLQQAQSTNPKRTGHELDGIKVLVAEDVLDNQVLMRRYLESSGAEVRFANNGKEAVEKALHDNFDVVLMDIQMPVLDGIQATRQLRAEGYNQPILALTAHAMAEEVARSIAAGCDAHLTKPITKRTLVDSIKEHLPKANENPGVPTGIRPD